MQSFILLIIKPFNDSLKQSTNHSLSHLAILRFKKGKWVVCAKIGISPVKESQGENKNGSFYGNVRDCNEVTSFSILRPFQITSTSAFSLWISCQTSEIQSIFHLVQARRKRISVSKSLFLFVRRSKWFNSHFVVVI